MEGYLNILILQKQFTIIYFDRLPNYPFCKTIIHTVCWPNLTLSNQRRSWRLQCHNKFLVRWAVELSFKCETSAHMGEALASSSIKKDLRSDIFSNNIILILIKPLSVNMYSWDMYSQKFTCGKCGVVSCRFKFYMCVHFTFIYIHP